MKKLLSSILVLCAVLSLVSCSILGPVHSAAPAEFSSNGMTITLTEKFRETSYSGYTVCYDSSEAAVFVLKESFSLQAGLKDETLDWYADLVRQNNSSKSPSEIAKADGLVSMEYEFYNAQEDVTYQYYTAMYKGSDAFWLVQFACKKELYNEYRPHFIKWAQSVDVSSAS